MNIESSKITVFPATKRDASYHITSRALSESNLTSIVNRFIDKDGFVISYKDNAIEFNIHGYYIKITDIGSVASSLGGNEIWASISVSGGDDGFVTIDGQDAIPSQGSVSQYSGVDITTASKGTGYYNLRLLKKVGSAWEVPAESEVAFTGRKLENIDGGDI